MLIFGFRVTNRVLGTIPYVCDRCGTYAAHDISKRVRKFTLFFVPLFPVSSRHEDICVACGRVLQVSKEQAQAALAR